MTERTQLLIGERGVRTLAAAHVLVVGLGGVGGCVFEMLVRAGVGTLTAVDDDCFEESNLNRQLLATRETLGQNKAHAAALRAASIAPNCVVHAVESRFTAAAADALFATRFDCVADCIDSVADKTALVVAAKQHDVPIVSALGAGNRTQPHFAVCDVFKTQNDGLARALRKKLRDAGVDALKVICDTGTPEKKEGTPGTVSYAPNLMGCMLAQEVIAELLWKE